MKKISIEAVPADQMRPPYDQEERAGDWFREANGDMVIRATGTDLDDEETFLYALHELVEMYLCKKAAISQATVDAWDEKFEGGGEPGDHPDAPYRRQHRQACLVEFLVADMMGLAGYGKIE